MSGTRGAGPPGTSAPRRVTRRAAPRATGNSGNAGDTGNASNASNAENTGNTGNTGKTARRALGLALCAAAVVLATLASLALGSKSIPPDTVLGALTTDVMSDDAVIVRDLRLPRTFLGLAVGGALGLAGAVMQGLTRNPLADPAILGVSAGAAFAIVLAISLLGVASLSGYVWYGLIGASMAGLMVYAISARARGGATPTTLLLTGAAVTAFLGSLTSAVLLLDARSLDQFRFWVVGSLSGRGFDVVVQSLPFLAAGAVLALATARTLDTLSLGDEMARALGSRLALARVTCASAVVLLTGAAVAAAGPIVFIGLAVPHIARRLAGPTHRWLLPYSALIAAALLVAADVAGRLVARPSEVAAGVVTALIGAPFLVALVRRRVVVIR